MTVAIASQNGRLKIIGELTIYTAEEAWSRLLAATGEPLLELDLSAVTEIDTAGLQILLMALRGAGARRPEARWVNPSPPVAALCELLRLPPVGASGASEAAQ